MREFIAALEKASSMTCIAKQRSGVTTLEFFTYEDAEAFLKEVERISDGHVVIESSEPETERTKRKFYNLKTLAEIFNEYDQELEIKVNKLPPIYDSAEGDHEVWRFQLTWRFESANKGRELFDRLGWICE